MRKNNVAKEIPGLILTGARYVMAERIARKVDSDEPVATDLAGFVAADILDGAILRRFNADTPLRRVADGVVDHLAMARVGYETIKKNPDSKVYLGILAARATLVGGANTLHLAKTGEVTKGQKQAARSQPCDRSICPRSSHRKQESNACSGRYCFGNINIDGGSTF